MIALYYLIAFIIVLKLFMDAYDHDKGILSWGHIPPKERTFSSDKDKKGVRWTFDIVILSLVFLAAAPVTVPAGIFIYFSIKLYRFLDKFGRRNKVKDPE